MISNRKYIGWIKVTALVLSALILFFAWVDAVKAADKSDIDDKARIIPSGILVSALDTVIDVYAADHKDNMAAVSVVALKDGVMIFNKAYGYADLENQVVADTDTVFEWGSCSKLLIWTSVMQLVEQGKLDLGTDIREYLPKGFLKHLQYDTPLTLMNLMNHNAGWQDKLTDLFYFNESEIPDLREALQAYEPKQVYKPGSVVAYSNFGAALAAYIVEVQSGQPFYKYVDEHIFSVLGMDNTSIHPSQQDRPQVAQKRNEIQGYTTSLQLLKNNRAYIGLYPAGSATGTATDAAKFLNALMPITGQNSALFASNDTLDEMLSPSLYFTGSATPRIAHGFFETEHLVRTLEHGGNTLAFSSRFVFNPEANFALIVMTNQQNEWNFNSGLVDTIFGKYEPQAYAGVLPSPAETEGYYLNSRRVVSGFAKIFGFLGIEKVKAIDDHSIMISGNRFEQVAPYEYLHDHSSELKYFVVNKGIVKKLSSTYGDFVPIVTLTVNIIKLSILILGICILFNLITLLGECIRFMIHKAKRVAMPACYFHRYHMGINIAGLVCVVNISILLFRSIVYTTYSSIMLHLILNGIYVMLAAVYIALLVWKLRNLECSNKRKILYVLSGITAFVFAATIIGWNLYF